MTLWTQTQIILAVLIQIVSARMAPSEVPSGLLRVSAFLVYNQVRLDEVTVVRSCFSSKLRFKGELQHADTEMWICLD